jgi:hypothetical protein
MWNAANVAHDWYAFRHNDSLETRTFRENSNFSAADLTAEVNVTSAIELTYTFEPPTLPATRIAKNVIDSKWTREYLTVVSMPATQILTAIKRDLSQPID